jgi:hypothetical protein
MPLHRILVQLSPVEQRLVALLSARSQGALQNPAWVPGQQALHAWAPEPEVWREVAGRQPWASAQDGDADLGPRGRR